jgi:hypothetical protein
VNAVLTQRKYRLAARLATDTARTFGLWLTAGFVVLVIVSAILHATTAGESEEYAYWALQAVPLAMLASGWVHLYKGYPLALANGLTRKEFLTGFALYGLATVLVAAALTQLGRLILDQLPTTDSKQVGFYGLFPLDSLARPALWFTVGAAAGAAMLRSRSRWFGAFVSALFVAAVVYRPIGISLAISIGQELPLGDGTLIELPLEMSTNTLALIDLALAVPLALITWALLARAPMRPKPA